MDAPDFLWKSGTPEIVVLLDEKNLTVNEIVRRVQVSEHTVRKRINKGKEYEWWAMGAKSDVNDTAQNNIGQAYHLLPAGRDIARRLHELGIAETIDRHRTISLEYQQEMEKASQEFF